MVGGPETCTLASSLHTNEFVLAELIERWFNELTERRLRRGAFSSVPHLVEAIEIWAEHWNDDPKPFVWHKQAEEIIAKVRRGRALLPKSNPRRATSVLVSCRLVPQGPSSLAPCPLLGRCCAEESAVKVGGPFMAMRDLRGSRAAAALARCRGQRRPAQERKSRSGSR